MTSKMTEPELPMESSIPTQLLNAKALRSRSNAMALVEWQPSPLA